MIFSKMDLSITVKSNRIVTQLLALHVMNFKLNDILCKAHYIIKTKTHTINSEVQKSYLNI